MRVTRHGILVFFWGGFNLVSSILSLLGVKVFHLVLSQMQYALKEGSQPFVLAYTLYDLLAAIRPSLNLQLASISVFFSCSFDLDLGVVRISEYS